MANYFSEKSLLAPPMERAAFSDRQAYVCAELSRLAYFKFEGGHAVEEVLAIAREVLGENEKFEQFAALIQNRFADSQLDAMDSLDSFKKILNQAQFEQVITFDEEGTQGFLCTRSFKQPQRPDKIVAYLAFRGTEPTEFKDIKTDINARLKKVPVGDEEIEFHSGYSAGVDLVSDKITGYLENTPHNQLIVTGHSLGGALGIVFTRRFAASVNGACYTFGAPPVGTIEVQNGLKTPVYEIINELDIVPNLPNPWLGSATSLLLRLLWVVLKAFTVTERMLATGTWDEKLEAYIEMMTLYRHSGYKSYLVGAGKAAKLRYNLSSFDRMGLWFRMIFKSGFSRFGKLVSDHDIDVYVEKLKNHALGRN